MTPLSAGDRVAEAEAGRGIGGIRDMGGIGGIWGITEGGGLGETAAAVTFA